MRGLATAFPRCVRGCPYLTAGVERVGHIASDGNPPAVASPPPVREVCGSRRRRRGGSGRPRFPGDGPHERGQLARDGGAGHGRLLAACRERPVARRQPALRLLQLPTSSTSRRGGYSCGFDLRLDPIRLDHVGALKRLSTEEHDLEDSQQPVDATGKDVSNCKRLTATLRAGCRG